ncbi:phytanoyl-CoA dioxygenase family protein [Azospirillum sp. RWY-5-1]|uniref:Phytanoyl-CoA dioxygenase family protein n=1 Tax=Azospirillum oleiclasticum TaxID=2735135 RepID=A0ABX2THM1_9PROT|nr:phytanoyl-CoA dioxygenase family protein [Azospirillum oleiclasticum]NYZ15511.1 phytanoyl-CoA dioxygenase family protein [Azospirillum oleiclasticum]NYZ22534.1 phytanoyl-CoA dioxygenase family protein [Azospirillum oleiclasticum]
MAMARSPLALTPDQIAAYNRDGFVVARGMFSPQEVELIRRSAEEDDALKSAAYFRSDSTGSRTRMTVWNEPGDDIFGLFSRSARIVDSMESLIGEEVYHYNSKLNAKDPQVGGAWEWHQDYGYWYASGCLFPRMATCILALDPSTRENGCLQVLRGAHECGRIDHMLSGKQVSCDPRRMEHLLERLERVHVEQEPGDVLFFHANMPHASDANASDKRRWVLISCYNGRSNSPVIAHHHPAYTPLSKVDDGAILAAGVRPSDRGKVFVERPYNPLEDAERDRQAAMAAGSD